MNTAKNVLAELEAVGLIERKRQQFSKPNHVYALMSAHSCGYLYLRCTKHADSKFCSGCGTIRLRDLEAVVYQQMVKKLEDYKTLTGRKKKEDPPRAMKRPVLCGQHKKAPGRKY